MASEEQVTVHESVSNNLCVALLTASGYSRSYAEDWCARYND